MFKDLKANIIKQVVNRNNFLSCVRVGVWTIAPEENCPRLGLGCVLGIELILGLRGGGGGGQFSSGAIVLEPWEFCKSFCNLSITKSFK